MTSPDVTPEGIAARRAVIEDKRQRRWPGKLRPKRPRPQWLVLVYVVAGVVVAAMVLSAILNAIGDSGSTKHSGHPVTAKPTGCTGPDIDIVTYQDHHVINAGSYGWCFNPRTATTTIEVTMATIRDMHAAGQHECDVIGLDKRNPNFFSQQGTYLKKAPKIRGPLTTLGDCAALAGLPQLSQVR